MSKQNAGGRSAESIKRWYARANAAIKAAEKVKSIAPHVGRGNSKTAMINEGTTPGLCGSCDPSCVKDCQGFCYAIWHMDNLYSACRRNHAENLVCRRRDPVAYYRAFFEAAAASGCAVRVNESGDFETARDVAALERVARAFPAVRVIGYSKRFRLLPAIARLNALPNVVIHFSLACSGRYENHARANGVPCTRVTFKAHECNCPFQRLKMAGKSGAWHCATCAAKKCGCFSGHDVAFLAH